MQNQQQNQASPGNSEQNKPAGSPEHNKPEVVKPGETPTQKPAGTEPKSNT